ncbi:hypothetical protein KC333_g28 [Hortaea werneckii]|nr:hypothetical protein KC333_g28 [Hortaea werneckii]
MPLVSQLPATDLNDQRTVPPGFEAAFGERRYKYSHSLQCRKALGASTEWKAPKAPPNNLYQIFNNTHNIFHSVHNPSTRTLPLSTPSATIASKHAFKAITQPGIRNFSADSPGASFLVSVGVTSISQHRKPRQRQNVAVPVVMRAASSRLFSKDSTAGCCCRGEVELLAFGPVSPSTTDVGRHLADQDQETTDSPDGETGQKATYLRYRTFYLCGEVATLEKRQGSRVPVQTSGSVAKLLG